MNDLADQSLNILPGLTGDLFLSRKIKQLSDNQGNTLSLDLDDFRTIDDLVALK